LHHAGSVGNPFCTVGVTQKHVGYNTKDVQHYTNVVQHLKAKHSEQYVKFEKALENREEDKGKGKAVLQQISLPEASE